MLSKKAYPVFTIAIQRRMKVRSTDVSKVQTNPTKADELAPCPLQGDSAGIMIE